MKQDAVKRMLFGPDPYTSKSLIRLYGGYSTPVATAIFDKCREIDNERREIDIDLRPSYVLKSTFFEVIQLDIDFEIARLTSNYADIE